MGGNGGDGGASERVCWLRALRALISGAGLDQKLDWMGAWEAGHRSRQSQMAEGWREGEEEGKKRSGGCSDAGLNSSARLHLQSHCPAVMLGYGRHTALDYQYLVCFVHSPLCTRWLDTKPSRWSPHSRRLNPVASDECDGFRPYYSPLLLPLLVSWLSCATMALFDSSCIHPPRQTARPPIQHRAHEDLWAAHGITEA